MNEKFNKNTKVEQLTKVILSHGEEKGLIVKDPYIKLKWEKQKEIEIRGKSYLKWPR